MPIHVETTARIAIVYKFSRDEEGRANGTIENYRGPIEILDGTHGRAEFKTGGRFEAVRPPLGGGGYARLSELEAAGYRVEVIELRPVPESGQGSNATIERTSDGMAHLSVNSPFFPPRIKENS
ncbi:hypothetical protein SEA_FUZZBUSTER_70 [Microbacterium phage FuzzBuster]|uniref:Uncharacterized protein n=1 Tax=Microbacterium phage FuzzBuster TaxID=2590935 RepID=A0A516KV52_9CAUD|nr:hypothetical protein SEA_FUZZBUSTER_70 [Microbacterium phage FuzzBuster]